jgi:hypothetical protein
MEHTDDPEIARQIAKDHLVKDPHFYTKERRERGPRHVFASGDRGAGGFMDYVDDHASAVTRGGQGHARASRYAERPNYCPPSNGTILVAGEGLSGSDDMVSGRMDRSHRAVWDSAAKVAKKMLAQHGIQLGEELGCGKFGCAFDAVDKPYIIKLTGDGSEAAAWQQVINAVGDGTWPEGLAVTYCTEMVPDEHLFGRMFIIMQEELEPIYEDVEVLINDILIGQAIVEGNAELLRSAIKAGRYGELDDDIDPDDADAVSDAEDGIYNMLLPLIEATNFLYEHGIEWGDLHTGNIMQTHSGDLRIVDVGNSSVPETAIAVLGEGS